MTRFTEREFWQICRGDKIGEGISRKVYEFRLDPSLVVKVEQKSGRFQNIHEYQFWEDFQWENGIARWLAPCVAISPCGSVLIQKKVEPLRRSDLPKLLPIFLTDLKITNFGLYEGRVVACDYATILDRPNTRLKNADWSL